jgi:hypothetical protein
MVAGLSLPQSLLTFTVANSRNDTPPNLPNYECELACQYFNNAGAIAHCSQLKRQRMAVAFTAIRFCRSRQVAWS